MHQTPRIADRGAIQSHPAMASKEKDALTPHRPLARATHASMWPADHAFSAPRCCRAFLIEALRSHDGWGRIGTRPQSGQVHIIIDQSGLSHSKTLLTA
jgi:hypothetical protein